ncbi:MAG: YkvA family protein [Porphyromonas sp.]|nr:YkvA family protein [Porphyromonas sp.]
MKKQGNKRLADKPVQLSDLAPYAYFYRENRFLSKLCRVTRVVGSVAVEQLLTLYYLLKEGDLNIKDKATLIAALGYFISPIDIIPDFVLPLIGFSDDLAVASIIIHLLRNHITPEIKEMAASRTRMLFL